MYCADCGTFMRLVSYLYDQEERMIATVYQCQKCKRIDVELQKKEE